MPRLPRPSPLTALLCVSVILNLVLATQIIRSGRQPRGLTTEARLEAGAAAPAIAAKTLRGEPVSVSPSGGDGLPLIIYVFTPRCVWCARNLDNAKALAAATKGRYNFVALSLADEGLEEYVARHDIGFTVYRGVSAEARAAYMLGRTPQTIVISPGGRVEKNWVGAYGAETESRIEDYFQKNLPGLSR